MPWSSDKKGAGRRRSARNPTATSTHRAFFGQVVPMRLPDKSFHLAEHHNRSRAMPWDMAPNAEILVIPITDIDSRESIP